ncbi:DUF899 domain-containing protein [Micromonospora sp. WMMD882]|uniref:DUF899 domain-containing protein n=1 Tax=Micromonospora sp. WMMD882 TaxID=3015151 RepID=UPI00248BBBDB|nr:DUF899 domain-containing protein [Micromonospora sp. WMMD882]WBB78689.1 DUF899 domain-containing protein [Micromonospora sp. WMMD882]
MTPRVVSRDEWLVEREKLLVREKQLTRERDAVSALRRELPMVRIDKTYTFEGPEGSVDLLGLFDGSRQLIVRHYMFHPNWDEGCAGCSLQVDNLGHPAHLRARDTNLVLISRAPLAKLTSFKERMGWTVPWYSSFATDFNQDFGVTRDNSESSGLSVFLRDGDDIFHTYSSFSRGGDALINTYNYLDLTPLGRQEAELDYPQQWWRLHDQYEN